MSLQRLNPFKFVSPRALSVETQKSLFERQRARQPTHYQLPVSVAQVLESRTCTVFLELGAGDGQFSETLARGDRDAIVISLEKTVNRFSAMQRRHAIARCSNWTALHAHAVTWVSAVLPVASIDAIFLMYPNPYLKTRQRNLRWHHMPFADVMVRSLKRRGRLMVATNTEGYMVEAETVWPGRGLELVSRRAFLQNDPHAPSPRTAFEKKYLERGERCFESVWEKP